MTQKLTIDQMKEIGMPDWMIERISTCCVNCDLWDGQCNAGMFCKITVSTETSPSWGFEYHFSIGWWLTMQKMKKELSL